MKTRCLNIQDCGYSKALEEEELKSFDFKQPFGSCPLCGYYTVTTPHELNVTDETNREIFKKIYKQLRK
jgi:excinuclease UvrABC ATPase subunit